MIKTPVETAEPSQPGTPDFNAIISVILRAGVLVSSFVVGVGLILYVVRAGGGQSVSQVFQAAPSGLTRMVARAITGMAQADPRSIIELGIMLLLATPVFRVGASILLFLAERDWLYTIITTLVLAILLVSIFELH